MRKPNFFIVGAPKCGTTSLAEFLAEHPHVFISPIKEPHFFNTGERRNVNSLDQYEQLFNDATDQHIAIGEASVWYLSDRDAVQNILRYQPDARFIVMLRNPVEMAVALHAEMILAGHENVHEFEQAWALQDERRCGKRVPLFSWAKRRMLYGDVCALGSQLQTLYTLATPERILPVLLEDMVRAPREHYLRILGFLSLDDDGRCLFPALNKARAPRSHRLVRFAFLLGQFKFRLNLPFRFHLWDRVALVNVVDKPRPEISMETRAMLSKHFRTEINLLGKLLDRDLSHWLG